jgi:hypothetical protein
MPVFVRTPLEKIHFSVCAAMHSEGLMGYVVLENGFNERLQTSS